VSETQPLSRLDIERWRADKDDAGKRERQGYVVWLVVGIVIAVPEIWAAIGQPPWPTISATIGHLEALQNLVAIVVVALIVAAAVHSAGYRRRHPGEFVTSSGRPRGRTAGGRLTTHPGQVSDVPAYAYFPPAVGAVAAGTGLAYAANGSSWVLAYVLYGLIAVCCLVIPNVLAFWFAREVPFPTLFGTVADLERRWHPVALIIQAGLAVLLIHLAFYPWPDIFSHVTMQTP
jgi:hypothetical protein